jgi:hypothetical protein
MPEHDPLATEFAALRTAVLVRPPGVRAAQARVRQRRHRTVIVLSSVIAFAVAAAGVAVAQIRPPRPELPSTRHTASKSASPRASTTPGYIPGPSVPAGHPPGGSTSRPTNTGPACHQYGAVLLDRPTSTEVAVRVDQQGLYPLCPNERVRVFIAVYSLDANQNLHLFYSKTGYLDAAHNPLTLPYQVPACGDDVFVMSGNQAIKQTIPAMSDPYVEGPLVYGSPQWGPYNGVVWITQQDSQCPTPTATG